MTCPHCGTETAPDARFCPSCGESLGDVTTRVAGVPAHDDETDPNFTPVDVDTADLRLCPRCGAENSPRRMLCGRCGADLSGSDTPGYDPRAEQHAEELTESKRRTAMVVVLGSIMVGIAIGILLLTGVVGGEEDGDTVDFDASRYPTAPQELPIGSIGASTVDDDHRPPLMADGDLATAWHNQGDVNPGGIGEVVELDPQQPIWLTDLVIGNGDQSSDEDFQQHARVTRARLVLDDGQTRHLELLDRQGLQIASLDEPVLTTVVRLEVLEVARGAGDDSVAISEISLRGHQATGPDVDRAIDQRGAAG